MDYSFEIPAQHSSIIKVMGVGGGGSNAVKHMFNTGIKDVEFVVCNTDAQALNSNPIPNKLQIGTNLTEGLGAGANPEVGREAALESREEIRDLLTNNTKLLFITAGMGGGTGTGAAPVIAQISRELGILTVGIVTSPFMLEGPVKNKAARDGIIDMKNNCDIVLVVANDKLRQVYGKLKLTEALAKADSILSTAASSIAEIITKEGYVNVDFKDVNTVIKNAGTAVMGSCVAVGEDRGIKAVEGALESPLLENRDITGANNILLNISFSEEPDMDMFDDILQMVVERSGNGANVIWGMGEDMSLAEDEIKVTIIATGFQEDDKGEIRYDLETDNRKMSVGMGKTPAKEAPSTIRPENILKDSKFEIVESEEETSDDVFDATRRRMDEHRKESQQRIERYKNKYSATDESDDNMMNTPSYLRRGNKLTDSQHSSEEGISRYTLNDDKDVLGNNSFLHDNVD